MIGKPLHPPGQGPRARPSCRPALEWLETRLPPAASLVGCYEPSGLWHLDANNSGTLDAPDPTRSTGGGNYVHILGDWDGDGRDQIGLFREGVWILDSNANGSPDPADEIRAYGLSTDLPVVGDWNGDGRDDIGIFRYRATPLGNSFGLWALDSNGSGAWDPRDAGRYFGFSWDTPVVGDWNGDGKDDIGICRWDKLWALDRDGSGGWNTGDTAYWYGMQIDTPVIGDWDGDGRDNIGIFRKGLWALDSNATGTWDPADTGYFYGAAGDTPLVGDWNGDGKDDIGRIPWYQPGRWWLDTNGQQDHEDTLYWYGVGYEDTPVVGDWNGDGKDDIGVYRDGLWLLDQNGSGRFDRGDRIGLFGDGATRPIVGDWNGDSKDDLGTTQVVGDLINMADLIWRLDSNGSGTLDAKDTVRNWGRDLNSRPVVGDWNGDGKDDLGVVRAIAWVFPGGVAGYAGQWLLDRDGSGYYEAADGWSAYGYSSDRPVVGDWNGDSRDDIGVCRNGFWILDSNGSRRFGPFDRYFFYGVAGALPVVGSWV